MNKPYTGKRKEESAKKKRLWASHFLRKYYDYFHRSDAGGVVRCGDGVFRMQQ